MNLKRYQCSLHHKNYQFFCERCHELVCKQCTIIGPHHTQIHSLTKISVAYEHRIQEIKQRIDNLVYENRDKIFKIIMKLNQNIEDITIIRNSIDVENNKEKERMIIRLMQEYQNNRNILHSFRQNILEKINLINDLGFKYQNLKQSFELLGSHNKIMDELKQLHDRLQLFIQKDISINYYTKELTEMRIKLNQIQSLNELYDEKLKILRAIIDETSGLGYESQSYQLDYHQLLKELNRNLADIKHNVCHFCGVVFTFDQLNNECHKNKVNLNDFMSTVSVGYCKDDPEASKLGTQRHYFGTPKNPLQYYDLQNQAINSFKLQTQALLLKVKTLCKIHRINIKSEFQDNDKEINGFCEKIVFDYFLIQILGLTERENEIIQALAKPSLEKPSLLGYETLAQQLQKINI